MVSKKENNGERVTDEEAHAVADSALEALAEDEPVADADMESLGVEEEDPCAEKDCAGEVDANGEKLGEPLAEMQGEVEVDADAEGVAQGLPVADVDGCGEAEGGAESSAVEDADGDHESLGEPVTVLEMRGEPVARELAVEVREASGLRVSRRTEALSEALRRGDGEAESERELERVRSGDADSEGVRVGASKEGDTDPDAVPKIVRVGGGRDMLPVAVPPRSGPEDEGELEEGGVGVARWEFEDDAVGGAAEGEGAPGVAVARGGEGDGLPVPEATAPVPVGAPQAVGVGEKLRVGGEVAVGNKVGITLEASPSARYLRPSSTGGSNV